VLTEFLDYISCRDFGMSRLIKGEYYKSKDNDTLPVRWSAPELFKGQPFTKKCDIYSFGVVVWEVIT
jgi:serine/threonine protein kinase